MDLLRKGIASRTCTAIVDKTQCQGTVELWTVELWTVFQSFMGIRGKTLNTGHMDSL